MGRSIRINYDTSNIMVNPAGSTLQNLASGVPSIVPTVLFSENFEDTSFTSRGWYDMSGPFSLDDVNPHSGSNCGKFTWQQGNQTTGPSGRFLFTPTDQVYVEYWVRYSSNYVGSQQGFHPHEWMVMTDEDGSFVAPADTHLSVAIETLHQASQGLLVHFGATDNANIDQNNIGVDLTAITEIRSANGCNGFLETSHTTTSCFDRGDQFVADRNWDSASGVISEVEKVNWHKIGAYSKLNSITGGTPDLNGILQWWVDDVLEIDHQGVVLRTGQFPDMMFNQILIAPFISAGSPVTQTIWYDDLKVATGKLP